MNDDTGRMRVSVLLRPDSPYDPHHKIVPATSEAMAEELRNLADAADRGFPGLPLSVTFDAVDAET